MPPWKILVVLYWGSLLEWGQLSFGEILWWGGTFRGGGIFLGGNYPQGQLSEGPLPLGTTVRGGGAIIQGAIIRGAILLEVNCPITRIKTYILFNKENCSYNDNDNNSYNGLFVTCYIVEAVYSITDAEEFSKISRVTEFRFPVLQSLVTDFEISGSQGLGFLVLLFLFFFFFLLLAWSIRLLHQNDARPV